MSIKQSNQSILRILGSECSQCFTNRGRVMRKIVDHHYAAPFPADLSSSLHVLKTGERGLNSIFAYTPGVRSYYDRQTVEQVELSHQGCLKFAPRLVIAKHLEARKLTCKVDIANLPMCFAVETESF